MGSKPNATPHPGATPHPSLRTRTVLVAFAASWVAISSVAPGQTSPRAIATDDAPQAVGPYSRAVVAGGFLFASGQIPRDPKTSQPVTGTFEVSMERVLDNLEAVLKAAGLTWVDVVKTTVYLGKAEDFAALNTVYAKRMGDAKPARSTVVVAGLPGGAVVDGPDRKGAAVPVHAGEHDAVKGRRRITARAAPPSRSRADPSLRLG